MVFDQKINSGKVIIYLISEPRTKSKTSSTETSGFMFDLLNASLMGKTVNRTVK